MGYQVLFLSFVIFFPFPGALGRGNKINGHITDYLCLAAALRQGQACLRWKKVDGPGAISVLFDEAAVVLRSRGRVHGSPAVLAVVAQAVDVATEVGGIAVAAVHSVTLITHLVVQHIWLHFNLQEKGWGGGGEEST